jgi:nitrilase
MKVIASVVQDSPIFFDKEKTIQKVEAIVAELSKTGSQLIVFPESFIPGYPRGFSFGTIVGNRTDQGRDLYHEYFKNSFDLKGPELLRFEKASKKYKVYLVIGVTEKSSVNGSLYCSMLFFSPKTGFLGVHRKIKPTGQERVIWHEDDGSSLVTFQTSIGKLGGLICWENYMPLARMSMYQKGVELYIAPTADARDTWISSMIHIALEGRCFVLASNQYFEKEMYPTHYQEVAQSGNEVLCRGGSMIVSPMGKVIAGPLFDQSGVLTEELDLSDIVKAKLDFDVIGHYSRDDIFQLEVFGQPDMAQEDE